MLYKNDSGFHSKTFECCVNYNYNYKAFPTSHIVIVNEVRDILHYCPKLLKVKQLSLID